MSLKEYSPVEAGEFPILKTQRLQESHIRHSGIRKYFIDKKRKTDEKKVRRHLSDL